MSHIAVSGFVVALLPLRIRRRTADFKQPGRTLYAHPDHGMPDGRDLLALLLCSHVAVSGGDEVVANDFVTPASLLRVATLRIELEEDGSRHLIRVARSWQNDRVRLSPEFIERCARSPRGKLPWRKLHEKAPGVIAVAMAIATRPMKSIALSWLMDRTGSGTASQSSRKQQTRRWVRMLPHLGFDDWFFDASRGVVFERARRVLEWVGRRLSPDDRHQAGSAHQDQGNSS